MITGATGFNTGLSSHLLSPAPDTKQDFLQKNVEKIASAASEPYGIYAENEDAYQTNTIAKKHQIFQKKPFHNSEVATCTQSKIQHDDYRALKKKADKCNQSVHSAQSTAIPFFQMEIDTPKVIINFLDICECKALRNIITCTLPENTPLVSRALSLHGQVVLLAMRPKQYLTCAKIIATASSNWFSALKKIWPVAPENVQNSISVRFSQIIIYENPSLYFSHHFHDPYFYEREKKGLLQLGPDLLQALFKKPSHKLTELLDLYKLAELDQISKVCDSETLVQLVRHLSEDQKYRALKECQSYFPYFDPLIGSIPHKQIKQQVKKQLVQILYRHPLLILVLLSGPDHPGRVSSPLRRICLKILRDTKVVLEKIIPFERTSKPFPNRAALSAPLRQCDHRLSSKTSFTALPSNLLQACYQILPLTEQITVFERCDDLVRIKLLEILAPSLTTQLIPQIPPQESVRIFIKLVQTQDFEKIHFFFQSLSLESKRHILNCPDLTLPLALIQILESTELQMLIAAHALHSDQSPNLSAEVIDPQNCSPMQLVCYLRHPDYHKKILKKFAELSSQLKNCTFLALSSKDLRKLLVQEDLRPEDFLLETAEIRALAKELDCHFNSHTQNDIDCSISSCIKRLNLVLHLHNVTNEHNARLFQSAAFLRLSQVINDSGIGILEESTEAVAQEILSCIQQAKDINEQLQRNKTYRTQDPQHSKELHTDTSNSPSDLNTSIRAQYSRIQKRFISVCKLNRCFKNIVSCTQEIIKHSNSLKIHILSTDPSDLRLRLNSDYLKILKKHFTASRPLQFQSQLARIERPLPKLPILRNDIYNRINPQMRYFSLLSNPAALFDQIEHITAQLQVLTDDQNTSSNECAVAIMRCNYTANGGRVEAIRAIYEEAILTLASLEESQEIENFSHHYSYDDMIECALYQTTRLEELGITSIFLLAKAILSRYLQAVGITTEELAEHNIKIEVLLECGIWGKDEIKEREIKSIYDLKNFIKK